MRVPAGVIEMTDAGMSRAVRSMRRFSLTVAVLASFAAGCTSTPSSAPHSHLAQCAAHALVLRPATPVPSMTGEHAVLYTLANRGPAACTVRGYPQVTLYDARGRVLPFRYADGGGAYVTARKPVRVVLVPGAMAYVLAAKYHCDLGIAQRCHDPAGAARDRRPGVQLTPAAQAVRPAGLVVLPRRPARPWPTGHDLTHRSNSPGGQQPALTADPGSELAILPGSCRRHHCRADSGK